MRLTFDSLKPVFERSPLASALEACVLGAERNLRRVLDEIRTEMQLDLRAARARAGFARGHLLDVVVYSPHFSGRLDESAKACARQLIQGALGERIAGSWIGRVEVAPLARSAALRVLNNESDEQRAFAIDELALAVPAAIRALYAGLPEAHCWAEADSGDWTLFELEPETAQDYAAQDDVVLATSMRPEMLKCFLQGLQFCSERFSRHAELFCYLKYESGRTSASERLAERSRIEDALSAVLVKSQLGAVVGNGLGLRYSYIDLALSDVVPALERVHAVAEGVGLPDRSWVLFCDSSLCDHWLCVGRADDTPYGFP
jgi:hypothetical protein